MTKAEATALAQKLVDPKAFALYDPWYSNKNGCYSIGIKLGKKKGRGTRSWQRLARGKTYEQAIERARAKLASYDARAR